MKVTIDRSKWSAGPYTQPSKNGWYGNALLTDRGKRCCLGFLGQACGLTDALARDRALPRFQDTDWPKNLFENSVRMDPYPLHWAQVFADINDSVVVDDGLRESWIAEGFRAVLGVEVEFVGEYPNAEPTE